MSLFLSWLGFPRKTAETFLHLVPGLRADLAEAARPPEPVAQVLLVFHDDRRELRSVFQVGEACFLWTHDLPDTAKRLLPHGRLAEPGPSFATAWEPISPPNWQPPGAETAHKRIARLETENARLNERLAAHTRLLRSIATAASDAATE